MAVAIFLRSQLSKDISWISLELFNQTLMTKKESVRSFNERFKDAANYAGIEHDIENTILQFIKALAIKPAIAKAVADARMHRSLDDNVPLTLSVSDISYSDSDSSDDDETLDQQFGTILAKNVPLTISARVFKVPVSKSRSKV